MSELLDATDIADLTALDESAMNEAFVITTVTPVDDGAGSSTETTTTAATIGYFGKAPTGDEVGADQLKALGRHRLFVKKDAVVAPTARITQQSTGKVFEVKYVAPIHGYSTSLEIIAEDA